MKTFNVAQAAALCHCHMETIREHIRSGKLVAVRIGRSYVITQPALDAFLNTLENDAMRASLQKRSEEKCRFINEKTVLGTSISQHKAARELDILLTPKTRGRRKSCTTKSRMSNGV
ncbi:helix-turn-helix domain-containing protein [Stenoxybacter acetivorans]|uniref:helix-turn-helix domain-containing protein n=1 Tax=Stenoxybacter acetivorans TaxID=422441 RepID=UPI0012EB5D4B|nr:helix-turn-helix domain-containing protein [Stenoxybacter acetivorans]